MKLGLGVRSKLWPKLYNDALVVGRWGDEKTIICFELHTTLGCRICHYTSAKKDSVGVIVYHLAFIIDYLRS